MADDIEVVLGGGPGRRAARWASFDAGPLPGNEGAEILRRISGRIGFRHLQTAFLGARE
jgi:hypothetical protein